MKLFSIITVTKNNARGLRITGKSLAVQSEQSKFEWIIVDGGSTDNTQEIIAQFPELNPIVISEADDGIYDAMNKGIDKATGEYVWFLNAGDCLSDMKVLTDLRSDVVSSLLPDFFYGVAREDGHILGMRNKMSFARGMVTSHQAMLYKRKIIGAQRYDTQYKIASDYDFTVEFLSKAQTIDGTPRLIVDVLKRGASNEHAALGRDETKAIREKHFKQNELANKFYYTWSKASFGLKQKYPKLYWKLRDVFFPPVRNRASSPVQSDIRFFRRKTPAWQKNNRKK